MSREPDRPRTVGARLLAIALAIALPIVLLDASSLPARSEGIHHDTAFASGTGEVSATLRRHTVTAAELLDTAIARMGGVDSLRAVQRVRLEMLTQWQRLVFDGRPYADQPTYESHTELRDYSIAAWRNTRRDPSGARPVPIVDVVRDSFAIRRSLGGSGGVASPASASAGTWAPLNIAYVDERRELFAMAPERLLLAAREARDLRALTDTSIAAVRYARVRATVDGFATTVLLQRSTGALTMAHFRAAETNDFGLVPFGEMDVEFWYSGWRKAPGGIVYPYQWDVRRVGQPYKRMTVLAAVFNPPATPDSFAVSDSLRTAYMATATRPMHEIPLAAARLATARLASFGTPGAPAGAVKLGRRWVMLETGAAPSSMARAAAWLTANDSSATLAAALLTAPMVQGGVSWLTTHAVPVSAGPGVLPFAQASLRGYAAPPRGVASVTDGRWMRIDGDSLWLEPIDLLGAPGGLVAYVPSLEWIYSGLAVTPLHVDRVLALARARGWRVSRIGSARSVADPVTPTLGPVRAAANSRP